MKIVIDKESGIPLYLQIKYQVKKLLENGSLKKNEKLPTERELSENLSVSRNTVSMAYKELVLENVLLSNPGRGTFINPKIFIPSKIKTDDNKAKLTEIIDAAINEALELNFELNEFKKIVNKRIEEKEKLLKNINIAFIECNQEQLHFFAKGIELGMGVSIIPILIDEMYNEPDEFRKKLESIDLIVTTFFHFDEVKKQLANKKQRVLAIALDPLMETMVNIAHLSSKEKTIGLVCITDKFAQRIFQSIRKAGIKYKNFKFSISHDKEKIRKFLVSTDIVITSPGRKKEVRENISPKIPLIEFVYVPDKGSIYILKLAILDLKREGGLLEKDERKI
ncbi:MAG: GntR family transcriptional regulator, partial [Candidatus Caldatribacteriota bacterium]|nr:GntR family transcriptional regulator [Candidatus Caldatribacteriota bacterium]